MNYKLFYFLNLRRVLSLILFSIGITAHFDGQICPEGPYEIGFSDTIPPCDICAEYDWGSIQREAYIDSSAGHNYGNIIGDDSTHFHDQWLDIYIPIDTASEPFPLYIFAHAGNQYADNAFPTGRDFCEENVAFISWESAQSSLAAGGSYYENDPELLMTVGDYWHYTHADFALVLDWVWENAEEYHIDLERVFVGGGSRGSRISFKDLDNPERPIRGIFMTQAFADGDWFGVDFVESQGCPALPVTEFVSEDYPPIVIHYKNNPGDAVNAHDALNGQFVQDRYDCLGLDSRIVHSLGTSYQWTEQAIEYIYTIEDYFEVYTESFVDSLVIDPESNILNAPAQLELNWSEEMTTDLQAQWMENNWVENMLGSPYPGITPESIEIEVRIGEVADLSSDKLLDLCDPILFDTSYAFDPLVDSTLYSFPSESFINTCSIPNQDSTLYLSMLQGSYYGVQVRCNITPSSNYYQQRRSKFWTPWTELLTFEGRCEPVIDGLEELTDIDWMKSYPNPSEGALTIEFRDIPTSPFSIRLIDMKGSIVRSSSSTPALNGKTIVFTDLPKGIFSLQFISSEKVATRSIIVY